MAIAFMIQSNLMGNYKLIQMFDVDKLYTYNYSTVETVQNPEELKELKDELKLFFSEEAKAGRNQYKELSDYVNDNWLDQNVYSEIMSRLNSIKSEHSRIKDLKNKIKSIKTKIVLNDKDSLVNDILDIHMSVLSNPNKELSRLILTPNGFGKFKTSSTEGLAFEIDAIKLCQHQ